MSKRQPTLWTFESGECTIRQDGLIITGGPTVDEWSALGRKLGHLRSGTQWAIGDWLLYGEERAFDADAYETAAEATGLKRATLMNLKSVAKAFPKPARAHEVPWSHYALVAGFDDEQRGELLARAAQGAMSWEELRAICRKERHDRAREWQKFPEGTFGVIVACPPWQAAPYDETVRGSMSEDEIAGLAPAVQGIAGPGCVLYLTVPNYRLEEGLTVMHAWGFNYRTNHAVMYQHLGNGDYTQNRHHIVLVATRGQAIPPEEDRRLDSLLGEGDELLNRLEYAYGGVPKVLLFGREERDGWSVWGERLDGMRESAPARALRVRNEPTPVIA